MCLRLVRTYLNIELECFVLTKSKILLLFKTKHSIRTHEPDQNPPQSYIAGPHQVQASHHRSSGPNTGSNSGGRWIIKKTFKKSMSNIPFIVHQVTFLAHALYSFECKKLGNTDTQSKNFDLLSCFAIFLPNWPVKDWKKVWKRQNCGKQTFPICLGSLKDQSIYSH